jgi:hypothetical protein
MLPSQGTARPEGNCSSSTGPQQRTDDRPPKARPARVATKPSAPGPTTRWERRNACRHNGSRSAASARPSAARKGDCQLQRRSCGARDSLSCVLCRGATSSASKITSAVLHDARQRRDPRATTSARRLRVPPRRCAEMTPSSTATAPSSAARHDARCSPRPGAAPPTPDARLGATSAGSSDRGSSVGSTPARTTTTAEPRRWLGMGSKRPPQSPRHQCAPRPRATTLLARPSTTVPLRWGSPLAAARRPHPSRPSHSRPTSFNDRTSRRAQPGLSSAPSDRHLQPDPLRADGADTAASIQPYLRHRDSSRTSSRCLQPRQSFGSDAGAQRRARAMTPVDLGTRQVPVCTGTDHAFAPKLTTPAIRGGPVRSVATRVPN